MAPRLVPLGGVALVLGCALLASCNSIIGINEPKDQGAIGGTPPATPGETPSAPTGADVTPFLGTWRVTGGTADTDCGGQKASSPAEGNLIFSRGTTSDLLVTSDTCTYKVNVDKSGDSAILIGTTQVCNSVEDGGAVRVSTVYKSAVFTLKSDGKTATLVLAATVDGTYDGDVIHCTIDEKASFAK